MAQCKHWVSHGTICVSASTSVAVSLLLCRLLCALAPLPPPTRDSVLRFLQGLQALKAEVPEYKSPGDCPADGMLQLQRQGQNACTPLEIPPPLTSSPLPQGVEPSP